MSRLFTLLSEETGLSSLDLLTIIRTAPGRYKVYTIPKRNGGDREIAQPAREVKILQRVLLLRLLADLPVHEAAIAYRLGRSIRDNADPHKGKGPILKMDFADFFPSIRSEDWERYCERSGILDKSDIDLSSLIFFRRAKGERLLKLSIGAPSSPALSNVLMFDFDTLVADEARRRRIVYTRYADDLTFSGQMIGMLRDMIKVVESTSRKAQLSHLSIHPEKTTFVTAKHRRVVTGIVLTNDGALSMARGRKRTISAQVHHASLGELAGDQLIELAGYLGFANAVEPSFLDRLRKIWC